MKIEINNDILPSADTMLTHMETGVDTPTFQVTGSNILDILNAIPRMGNFFMKIIELIILRKVELKKQLNLQADQIAILQTRLDAIEKKEGIDPNQIIEDIVKNKIDAK